MKYDLLTIKVGYKFSFLIEKVAFDKNIDICKNYVAVYMNSKTNFWTRSIFLDNCARSLCFLIDLGGCPYPVVDPYCRLIMHSFSMVVVSDAYSGILSSI